MRFVPAFPTAAAVGLILLAMPVAASEMEPELASLPDEVPDVPLPGIPPDRSVAAVLEAKADGAAITVPITAGPPIDKASDVVLRVSSAGTLAELFVAYRFAADGVRDGATVPRLIIQSMPHDMSGLDSIALRKSLFFGTLLPMLLRVNEDILHDRQRLLTLTRRIERHLPLRDADWLWLDALAGAYEVEGGDLDTLVERVDIIPPSLALAQAAVESGWGTSRSARQKNALFGQTNGAPDRYAGFDRLIDGAASYARNLNTHPAYEDFRERRAERRAAGRALDGYDLAQTLVRYSTRGAAYIRYVRQMIRSNELEDFDRAKLAEDRVVRFPSRI